MVARQSANAKIEPGHVVAFKRGNFTGFRKKNPKLPSLQLTQLSLSFFLSFSNLQRLNLRDPKFEFKRL